MIVVFGSINLDLIFAVPELPSPGRTVLGPAVRMEPGGKGANQAVAAASDGARVMMAGAVGCDVLAEAALAGLVRAGVDLSRVARVDAVTACAAVCVDPQGRNQIAVGSGANRFARAGQVEDALLGPETVLLLQMEVAPEETAALIRRARSRGTRIILNFAPALPLAEDALRMVDLLIANEEEADWLGGDAPALRARLGVDVVRTEGAAGVTAATGDGVLRLPAHAVRVVDTTAAGDCFTGVLAAALDRGASLEAALRRANRAAALCCTKPGSQGRLPKAAEI